MVSILVDHNYHDSRLGSELFDAAMDYLEKEFRVKSKVCEPVARRLSEFVDRQCANSDRLLAMTLTDRKDAAIELIRGRIKLIKLYYCKNPIRVFQKRINSFVYSRFSRLGGYNTAEQELDDFSLALLGSVLPAYKKYYLLGKPPLIKSAIQIAEWLSFTDQWVRRKISSAGNQIVRLRADVHLKAKYFSDIKVDFAAIENGWDEGIEIKQSVNYGKVLQSIAYSDKHPESTADCAALLIRLRAYLKAIDSTWKYDKQISLSAYLNYAIQGKGLQELSTELDVPIRQVDYAQQRLRYHINNFFFKDHWEETHEWLDITVSQRLGLSIDEWEKFLGSRNSIQMKMITLFEQGLSEREVFLHPLIRGKHAKAQWKRVLISAFEIRQRRSFKPKALAQHEPTKSVEKENPIKTIRFRKKLKRLSYLPPVPTLENTVNQFQLDVESHQLVQDAIALSGMTEDEFTRQALRVYAKTITGRNKAAFDDLSNISTSELLSDSKYSTHPGRASELTKRAIQAIRIYNANVATEKADRWCITQSAIASLTGSRASTIGKILEQFKDEIESHNLTYGLNDYSNRKKGKPSIKETINLVGRKQCLTQPNSSDKIL